MAHRLDPLLRPQSIAVLGASEREGTVGRNTVENLLKGGYEGGLYAVNPGRKSVLGVPCYPSLATLPEPVEHVIFAVADTRMDAALDDVIAHGARAATMMSSLVVEGDTDPPLRDRLLAKIRKAGLVVCGANGMGFYNFADGIWGCGFKTRMHRRGGNVAYISHSGSGMCGIVDSEERIDFNLVVSTGQELAVSMDEYLDYALEMPGTRAVGLFMETARDPAGLVRAFERARERGIPVVALKVGRTELSAKLTVSHSGAIAGEDAVYDAIFDRYGVHRARDMDELATSLILFAQPHRVGDGGLVSIHDSGGERQLLIDLASDHDVPLTQLSPASTQHLESLLDPGLPAVNPLDAWSTGGPDFDVAMQNCLAVLMSDPQAALGAVVHDRVAGGGIHAGYIDYLRVGHRASGKPAILVANRQGTGADPLIVEATREGFPVVDGLESFLRGVRHVFDHRDFAARDRSDVPVIPETALARMRARLADRRRFDENDALTLLGDAGLPANAGTLVEGEAPAIAAAEAIGYPVVLKTAKRGLDHKSELQGIHLGDRGQGGCLDRLPRPRQAHRHARAGRPDDRGPRRRDAARHGPRRAVRAGGAHRRGRRARRGAGRCGVRGPAVRSRRGRPPRGTAAHRAAPEEPPSPPAARGRGVLPRGRALLRARGRARRPALRDRPEPGDRPRGRLRHRRRPDRPAAGSPN